MIILKDTYHYVATWYSQKSLTHVQHTDIILVLIFLFLFTFVCFDTKPTTKAEQLRTKGETLLVVPCWWDGSNERFLPSFNLSLSLLLLLNEFTKLVSYDQFLST